MLKSFFVKISSEYLHSQTVKARELEFCENLPPPAMCPMSCVTCHVSHFMFHMSHVTCHMSCVFFYKVVKLVMEDLLSTGLPRLVYCGKTVWECELTCHGSITNYCYPIVAQGHMKLTQRTVIIDRELTEWLFQSQKIKVYPGMQLTVPWTGRWAKTVWVE